MCSVSFSSSGSGSVGASSTVYKSSSSTLRPDADLCGCVGFGEGVWETRPAMPVPMSSSNSSSRLKEGNFSVSDSSGSSMCQNSPMSSPGNCDGEALGACCDRAAFVCSSWSAFSPLTVEPLGDLGLPGSVVGTNCCAAWTGELEAGDEP